MRYFLCFLFPIMLLWQACAVHRPKAAFDPAEVPNPPDYAQTTYWAALPKQKDNADRTPGSKLKDQQATANADVFFLHPTTYIGDKGQEEWNASLDDQKLNQKTDKTSILHQASVFNGAGRVYAPRYRQAHLHAYFTRDKAAAKQAFELAYQDVKAAFLYYMTHFNEGRPLIIASHSQGTNHATQLIKELIDGKDWQRQLVVAYLVGMPIAADEFKTIRPCEREEQTNCFCSWRSWQRGHGPKTASDRQDIVVTNPLNWTTKETYADRSLNEGTVLKNFKKGFKRKIADAQVHDEILWVRKPKFFGRIFITFKDYHVADFNLFYVNVRNNAQQRVQAFLEQAP